MHLKIIFDICFCIQTIQKVGGLLERGIKESGTKYRYYSTSIPSSLPKHAAEERTQLQGLKHGLQG
jgi:hypothetical protein